MTTVTETETLITRREAILRVSALLGGVALVGGSSLLTACTSRDSAKPVSSTAFTTDDIAYLDEIADTILPTTQTPGAKAAKVGAFMALMVTDGYSPGDQQVFRNGMRALDEASKTKNSVGFMAATPAQRLALLTTLDAQQKSERETLDTARREERRRLLDMQSGDLQPQPKAADVPVHYFRMMKELALLGYFTSEIGYTKAMRYTETPGRFDPCVPYAKGDKAWASHA